MTHSNLLHLERKRSESKKYKNIQIKSVKHGAENSKLGKLRNDSLKDILYKNI